jgi:hypothetical protein
MRLLAWCALLAFPGTAMASGAAQLTLVDGMQLEVEIVETESAGFRVRIAQGVWFVPFVDLANFVDLPPGHQPAPVDWTLVLVGEPDAAAIGRVALGALDRVVVVDAAEATGAAADAVAACGRDVDCMALTHTEPGWVWFVHVMLDGTTSVRFDARHTAIGAAASQETGALAAGSAAVVGAAARSLGLDAPEVLPEGTALLLDPLLKRPEPSARRPLTPARIAALSFVPLPGFPSLLKRDYGAFGAAFATTVGVSAALIASTGAGATSQSERIGISVLGTYVASVASSQLFGHLNLRRPAALAVVPSFGAEGVDGVAVQLHLLAVGAREARVEATGQP